MNNDTDLQAVVEAARLLGTTKPEEVLPAALDLADVAGRLAYVRAVRAVKPDGSNLGELFPEMAKTSSQWNTYSLRPIKVEHASYTDKQTGELKKLDKARIHYDKPAAWNQTTNAWVDTDFMDYGWQPRHIAKVAQQAVREGASCRWYWHTHALDGESKARDLVWLEITAPGKTPQQQQPAPQAAPPQQAPTQADRPNQQAGEAYNPEPPQDRELQRALQTIDQLDDKHRGLVEGFMSAKGIPPLQTANSRQVIAVTNYALEVVQMQAHGHGPAGPPAEQAQQQAPTTQTDYLPGEEPF